MKDAKKFWNENKKRIIKTTVVTTVGCVAGVALCRNLAELKYYRGLFKDLKEFDNNFLERLDEIQKGALHCTSLIPTKKITGLDIGEELKTVANCVYENEDLITPETACVGALIFYK